MNNIVKHAFLLALWTPLFALAWTPGTPNPDWPHVVAGQKADTWMPEEGWAFANDEPGDFSVVPAGGAALDEGFFEAPRPCTWHGFAGNTFAIPAPDGFLSLKPGTVLSEYYADIAAADPANTLLANWVELEDGEVVCDAYVNELDALHGKRIGLSDFGQLAGMLAKTDLANDRHVSETLERTENAASGFFRERGVEAGGFSISGMRQLPPHRNDTGRIAFTLAMDAGFGGETVPTANSCCILWLRGNVLFFYMAQHARSADEMESAIAESRRKLDLWCDAVLAANRWQADAAASASDTLLQERAFERTSGSDARKNSSAASSFFGRIFAYAAVGAFVGLLKGAFRRKKTAPSGPSVDHRETTRMENASSEKPAAFDYLVEEISCDEYEGYVRFKPVQGDFPFYNAYFIINDAGNPPTLKAGDGFNAKLTLEYVKNPAKMPAGEKTGMVQDESPLSSGTKAVVEISASLGEGVYEAKMQDWKNPVYVDVENATDCKVGDKIFAKGNLRVDFEE